MRVSFVMWSCLTLGLVAACGKDDGGGKDGPAPQQQSASGEEATSSSSKSTPSEATAKAAMDFKDVCEDPLSTPADQHVLDLLKKKYEPKDCDDLVAKLQSVTYLNFENSNISSVKVFGYFSNLRALNLSKNQITDIKDLTKLSKLRYLNVQSNNITTLPAMSKLSELRAFVISNNPVADLSVLKKAGKLQNLYYLRDVPSTVRESTAVTQPGPQCPKRYFLRKYQSRIDPKTKKGYRDPSFGLSDSIFLTIEPVAVHEGRKRGTYMSCDDCSDIAGGSSENVKVKLLCSSAVLNDPTSAFRAKVKKELDEYFDAESEHVTLEQLNRFMELSQF